MFLFLLPKKNVFVIIFLYFLLTYRLKPNFFSKLLFEINISSIFENNTLVFLLPNALLLCSFDLEALILKPVKRKRKKPTCGI